MEAEISAALEATTLEDLISRHRRERKELQAKIQALKKNAPTKDKKKRKEAMEEVARLEVELEQRHEKELKAAQQENQKAEDLESKQETNSTPPTASTTNDDDNDEQPAEVPQQRISKAQKRRDKKAEQDRKREQEIRASAKDAQNAPKTIEANTLKAKLKERQLAVHDISSDGNCLYNAIRHQLQCSGLGNYTVQQLRQETANYIRAQKDVLIHYMPDLETGVLPNDDEFDKYCEAIHSTSAWGGQVELKALSSVLKVPIEVLQAEGPPTVQGADEFAGPNLVITFHRYLYRMGEHYNSTVPLEDCGPDETQD